MMQTAQNAEACCEDEHFFQLQQMFSTVDDQTLRLLLHQEQNDFATCLEILLRSSDNGAVSFDYDWCLLVMGAGR